MRFQLSGFYRINQWLMLALLDSSGIIPDTTLPRWLAAMPISVFYGERFEGR